VLAGTSSTIRIRAVIGDGLPGLVRFSTGGTGYPTRT